MSNSWDTSVYPDTVAPREFQSLAEKADYLHRVVSAFDFGLPPDGATLRLLSEWREIFDAYPLSGSPAYHALRLYFGWPPVEKTSYLGEPAYLRLDRLEGRIDGFEDCV